MESSQACLICQHETVHVCNVLDWGEMRRCLSCDFVFANPMTLPDSPESLYDNAYKGIFDNPGMAEYSQRFTLRGKRAKFKNNPGLFYGLFDQALTYLQKTVPKGSVVLDIGCGVGYWMSALRKNGFDPVGLDVAKEVVDMLGDEGFEVWHGTIDSLDPNWKQPAICTCNFVLHHLVDPVGFLATIRQKFPRAKLLVGVWNHAPMPKNILATTLPPRTLSWWGPQSLKQAMEKAGYRVGDRVYQPIGASEFEAPRIIRRFFLNETKAARNHKLLSIYYTVKPVIFWPFKFWKRFVGKPDTVLSIGHPG